MCVIRVWRARRTCGGEDSKLKIRRAIKDDSLALIACFSAASQACAKSYQNEELLLAVEQFRLRCGEAFTTVDGEASHVGR